MKKYKARCKWQSRGEKTVNRIELDEITVEIERGVSAALAIYTAMSDGPYPAEELLDGLFYIVMHLDDDAKKLRRAVDGEEAE